VPLVENTRDALFEGFGAGRVGVGEDTTAWEFIDMGG
tara:strand:- start:354 stop:464 length:111 start_codon:yes stop_codon:yes gene_type:complete